MSDETNIPAEKPVNDGGGKAPQADSEPTEEQVTADALVNEEGGSD